MRSTGRAAKFIEICSYEFGFKKYCELCMEGAASHVCFDASIVRDQFRSVEDYENAF